MAIVGTGLSGSAAAADGTHENTARAAISAVAVPVSAGDSGLANVSDEEGIAAVQRAFDLIGSIPEPLIKRVEAGDQDALREVGEFLNQNPQAMAAVKAFGWFGCAAGVAKFAAENGIGVAKAWKLVKNGKKVAKAVWAYVKHGKYPGSIDDDIANLIINSTGLPDLAHACL
ncbi:hypothetical protein [Streptomyces sp. NPDC087300]|uniref:hypothetical protein n=1 Tax=Streptomyces sp. NPDC087300 TaxID=3365780 RepID=UPI00382DD94A